jgi:hypothetical protein
MAFRKKDQMREKQKKEILFHRNDLDHFQECQANKKDIEILQDLFVQDSDEDLI